MVDNWLSCTAKNGRSKPDSCESCMKFSPRGHQSDDILELRYDGQLGTKVATWEPKFKAAIAYYHAIQRCHQIDTLLERTFNTIHMSTVCCDTFCCTAQSTIHHVPKSSTKSGSNPQPMLIFWPPPWESLVNYPIYTYDQSEMTSRRWVRSRRTWWRIDGILQPWVSWVNNVHT